MGRMKPSPDDRPRKPMACLSGIGEPHTFLTVPETRICPKCRWKYEDRMTALGPMAMHEKTIQKEV